MKVFIADNKVLGRTRPSRSSRREFNKFNSDSRAYVHAKGETIWQNLNNRRNRPISLYRSMLLEAHPELEGRIRWSQNAGCSCGCSPGFIIDHVVRVDGTPADIYLTITMDEPVDMSYVEMALS